MLGEEKAYSSGSYLNWTWLSARASSDWFGPWEADTIDCPGYCDVAAGSVFKVTVLSEFVMEEGELVVEAVDPVEDLPLVIFFGFLFLV